jgi:hypothetical protein
LRDYDPSAFLRNLIWNSRPEYQSFQMSGADNLAVGAMLARDRNAHVFVISGAWILPLLRSDQPIERIRARAARIQDAEARFVQKLKERQSQAQARIWTLADVLERPSEPFLQVLEDLSGPSSAGLGTLPKFRSMDGLSDMLQKLRNDGMNPYLAGDLAAMPLPDTSDASGKVVRLR